MENNTKVIPFAITKKREYDRQSCLDLLYYMKNYIPKTINNPDVNYFPFIINPIQPQVLGDPKPFNTECLEFRKYVDEVNNGNTGAQIKIESGNVRYIKRYADYKNEKINYSLKYSKYG
jgi:hypothetical protein